MTLYPRKSPFVRLSSIAVDFSDLSSGMTKSGRAFITSFMRSPIINVALILKDRDVGSKEARMVSRIVNAGWQHMKTLRIEHDFYSVKWNWLANVLDWANFGHLEGLQVNRFPLDFTSLERISLAPRLKSLQCDFDPILYGEPMQLIWPENRFRNLEAIDFRASDSERLRQLLASSKGKLEVLTFFKIRIFWSWKEPDIRALTSAIAGAEWSMLTHVNIWTAGRYGGLDHPGSWDDIRPLLSLLSLQSVKYHHSRGVHVSFDELSEALSTWRCLRCLHICFGRHIQGFPTSTTSAGLEHPLNVLDLFADISPNIEDIGLTFSGVTSNHKRDSHASKLRSLKNLDVTFSLPCDPAATLAYLSDRLNRSTTFIWNGEDLNQTALTSQQSPEGHPQLAHWRIGEGWEHWRSIAQIFGDSMIIGI